MEKVEEKEETKVTSKKKIIILAVLILIIGAGAYYWLSGRNYETSDNAQLDGDIVTLKAGVTAYVDKIYFTDNQQVKKGDTLIRFNTTALEAKVLKSEASLADAYAQIKVSSRRADAGINNAASSLSTANSNQQAVIAAKTNLKRAEEDFERSKKLLEIKAVTRQQHEIILAQLGISKADYAKALSSQQASIATANGQQASAQSDKEQIGTAKALLEQRKADLILAKEDLDHAYVIAPRSGLVTKRYVQEGSYITAGQSLCAVIDYGNLWIIANFKETQLGKIKPGQSVEIKIDAFPDLKLKGKIQSAGGATGAKFSLMPPDNASGNFVKVVQRIPVRIQLDKTEQRNFSALYPGLSAFVKVKIK
ncbi:HlyD family secretion protein [Flavobacterium luteolum]|uniref:HlyD family secretion protein n=1 Tax=Flavobacterium luteolum TaxID=3003259 RepID=UPI00248E35DD|nr:HlyD family secretion protein [Flavobacterium luteolum]